MPAHPSSFIGPAVAAALRAHAPEAEQNGRLHPAQLGLIFEHNWFSLFVPAACGGIAAGLPAALHLLEGIAWADGACGWVTTLCSGAGWFSGFMEPAVCARIWAGPRVCMAGSGAVNGIAKAVPGGWEINGRWRYASGAPFAGYFSFNAREEQQGGLVTAWVPASDVQVHDTWNAMGLCATASHSFSLQNCFVPHAQCFTIDAAHAVHEAAVYRFPFLQFAETTISVNLSGMAMRFFDLSPHVAERKKCIDLLEAWRSELFMLMEKAWQQLTETGVVDDALLTSTSFAAKRLANGSRQLVNDLFPFCGMEAAGRHTEINRVWRNIHTAGQHRLLR
ncbi:MAG: hypothetical protein QM664_03440 [Flavihumibacter sp.]